MNNIMRRKLIVFLLLLSLIISPLSSLSMPVEAASTDLTITGIGVKNDVVIKAGDWSKYTLSEEYYSTNNSLGFHKIIKAKGYDLFELIGKDNLKGDKDYIVNFTCADGFKFTKTISELKNTYYYKDFTEGSKVKARPMIVTHTSVLADYPKNVFAPPIKWTDKAITDKDKDPAFPKLTFGQTNIDDMNMSSWGKEVIKITIGEERPVDTGTIDSPYKHISYDGAPYDIDAITSATFTIEGAGVEGYRAISLRQIEEDVKGQEKVTYYEKVKDKVVKNTFEGINAKYLIDEYVKVKSNAGNIIFKNNSRQTIATVPIEKAGDYTIAYGVNEVPLVYLETDVGYRADKYNGQGCFKLVYDQGSSPKYELSNVAYIYVEEKDAKNIFEHSYAPYNDPQYTDYEIIIHGDKMKEEKRYKVTDIEKMKDIQFEDEYSLSNSEYFWYYNRYKGVKLWELLLKAGLDPKIDESTSLQFIAADNYNFAPMTIKDIKDSSLYGYYEKDATDTGDGTFDGTTVEPLHTGMPVIVAYGFNGYPYVKRPTDEGYNPGLMNAGGPLRVISGKTSYNDTNGSNQVQFIKEIIIGSGSPISIDTSNQGDGEKTNQDVAKDSAWNHNHGVYAEYLDLPVLRITGSQVVEPITLTLRQLESLNQYAARDIYSGDGIREFEGIILWDLISKFVKLKDGVDTPSVRVFSGQNYNQILRSSDQIKNGVLNSKGQLKQIILAYAADGYPLVPKENDNGYVNNNAFGPLRLIIEENKSMWIKWTDCIVVGTGDYEAPEMKDVKELDLPELEEPTVTDEKTGEKVWITYKNNTGKELTEASARVMKYDKDGNLWIGTNNGGLSMRTPEGKWTNLKEITTENAGTVKVDTCYAIAERENGELWVTLGSPTTAQGILVRSNDKWKLLTPDNSSLPGPFAQELELDGKGGLWIGTGNSLVHVDAEDKWTLYGEEKGLLPYSVDAIELDDKGGIWMGYYPVHGGTEEEPLYYGGYEYLDPDGNVTTYNDFDPKDFNLIWVRSISIDTKGGVWIVRSGNIPGMGQGEIDYIINGERTVYQAKDLYPEIDEKDDIRLVMADKEKDDVLYIATLKSGLVKTEGLGKVVEKTNSSNYFPTAQWDSVYALDSQRGQLLIGTNGGVGINKDIQTFPDIKTHWAKDDIEYMTTMGYVKGSNGQYKPEDNISRAEFFAFMVRILGIDEIESKTMPFQDVKSTDWFATEVLKAKEAGLLSEYTGKNFEPNKAISRREIALAIGNALNQKLESEEIDEILSNFKDKVLEGDKSAIAATLKAEIIKGFPDNTFRGDLNSTRAQALVMLFRFLKY